MGHDPVLVRRDRTRQGGQAIIMVTLALIAMCGLLGLAVDFGWAYFVKRAAQSAADAAAVAAVEEMRRMTGFTGPYPCLNGGTCRDDSAPFDCTSLVVSIPGDNLDNACLYAHDNGFVSSGRQSVKVSEGTASAPPTLSGVPLLYWTTVRVSESVPQLFAAITGNPYATVSARATAGLYQGTIKGSIILTNRETDVVAWGAGNPTGANLEVSGNANVTAGGGILMASQCAGGCLGNTYAGSIQGNTATVTAAYTNIRGTGDVSISGGNQARWSATPTTGGRDGSEFQDPMRRKANPPVDTTGLANCPVEGGVIDGTNGPVYLGPGKYYSVPSRDKFGNPVNAGEPIQIRGDVQFRAGGSCLNGGVSNPSGFGTYVIYGGVALKSGGSGGTSLSFESGEIVFAGAKTQGGNAAPLMDMSANGAFTLNGPGSTAAGNVFVFTDPGYNNGALGALPPDLNGVALKQGVAGFKSGNQSTVSFTLDGLREAGAGFPAALKGYNEVVMWQDRRNSSIKYNADGTYACAAPYTGNDCVKSNQEQATDGMVSGSPEMTIAAGANTTIRGVIYQPRGAWATIGGSGGMQSALQLMSGALKVNAGGVVNLTPVTEGVPVSIVGLVE